MKRSLLEACLALVLAVMVGVARSDDKSDEDDRAAQLKRMKGIAEQFEIQTLLEAKSAPAQLVPKPLLRYTDSTRRQEESTLWIWTERERPIALMAVEFYPKRQATPWLFEIVSLSDSKIGVARGESWKWQAKQPGIVRRPLPGDIRPSDKPALRLTQARQIRQRFAAHEKEGTDGRIELRPLSTPLYRYADEPAGVIDGAVFAFANGTNPEVLLLLEAQRDPATKSAIWTYGFAQMTGAAVSANLDDQEVWSQPDADPPASRDSYVNGWLNDEGTEPRT